MGKFDMGEFAKVLASVPDSGTDGREQIEYIDLTLLDQDDYNFYALSGLDELASNIAIVGIQQPLRVRPMGDGRYAIVSGHRRREALWKLVQEGMDKFRQVPCIVESPADSPALQELKLIYANSDTRVMSSADISKQAERVEMLLYQLKEEGYEFPGRMRDHVAQACKVSKTKLANLKVIRDQLQEPFQGQFQRGEINESAALYLARIPKNIQADIAEAVGPKHRIFGGAAENLLKMAEQYYTFAAETKCPDGTKTCDNVKGFLRRTGKPSYSWQYCEGRCCAKCYSKDQCTGACATAKARVKAEKENQRRKDAAEKKRKEKEQGRFRANNVQAAKRLLRAAEAAGLEDDCEIKRGACVSRLTVKILRQWAAGDTGDAYFYGDDSLTPSGREGVVSMAKQLGCSTDYILGLTDDLTPSQPEGQLVLAGWMPGGTTPATPCDVVADFDVGAGGSHRVCCYWNGTAFLFKRGGATIELPPIRWMMLPPVEVSADD